MSSSAVTQSHVLNMFACFIFACDWAACWMLLWCLVRMSGMFVIVRLIYTRSELRVRVRVKWPHPPQIRCDFTSWPADGGLSPANPLAGMTPNIVGSSSFFSALKLWRFLDSAVFFLIIIFMRNVTYAGIYHWRVYIYRMGHNLLECKYAHVTRVFFNDLYMWASFVTLNVFQFWLWLFSCETECLIWCTLPRCTNASRIWDKRVNRSWPDVF